ncbi:hypothetical protein GCM10027280_54300 [Micromonospora polyrhachis]|uniref:Uncharacterized protein n=1 Tax=Micromonospora polyrhachis TaxID=1282883 RepID=A0A7W7WSP7_9ACTN|nr:hypothetical protein [Micromonospora polyrhachis]MBB4961847.1 hypothetical protein [Micromonospora polyrhachis]
MKRSAITLSLTVALATTISVGAASPAVATPTDCSYSVSGYTASSLCASGTGEHRVKVLQRHLQYGDAILIEGPWKPVGETSTANLTPHRTERVWVETR